MNTPNLHVWPRAAIGLLLSFAVLSLAMYPSVVSLWELWWDSDAYGHGVFVPPIIAYAVWLLKDELRQLTPQPVYLGALAMFAGLGGWLVATLTDIAVGHQLAFVAILAATVITACGWRIAAVLWFPLAFPFLAIPVWDAFVPILQEHTALVTASAARAFGVPVYVEGFFIAIPSGNFEIAEVCAGLRYLLAMASISAFYVFLNSLTFLAGVSFFCISLLWAILFNWIRVTGIVLIGHWSEMQSALVHDHYTYGWILFAVALVPLFVLGRWFKVRGAPATVTPEPASRLSPALPIAAACLVSASALMLMWMVSNQTVELRGTPSLSPSAGRWQMVGDDPDWQPHLAGVAWSAVRRYRDADGSALSMFAGVFTKERQDEELINTQNRLYNPKVWTPVSGSRVVTAGQPARKFNLQELRTDDGRTRTFVWYTYRIGGAFEHRALAAKIRQIPAIVRGKPAGAVVAFRIDSGHNAGGMEQMQPLLDSAVQHLLPAVADSLDQEMGF